MNSRVVFVALLALLCVNVARAEGESMEVDAEGAPLRKPIIMHHGSSPDHVLAIGKIGKILSREPLSANAIKKSEDDDSIIQSLVPVKADVSPADIKAHIKKENMMHRNAALARLRSKLAKKLGKKASKASLKKAGLRITKAGKIVRKKSIFDDDDEKLALEKEIRLLEKLIGQGRKIWSALPEKEARLAALRKKIAEMAKGKAKAAAKKKLKALLALLDKVNDKIEALNNKLKQLLKRKAAITKQITKYRAIIAGGKAKKAAPKPAVKGTKKVAKKAKKAKKATKKVAKKAKKAKKATKKAKKVVKKAKAKKSTKKAAKKGKKAAKKGKKAAKKGKKVAKKF
jgi:chromosome segregation ATPase